MAEAKPVEPSRPAAEGSPKLMAVAEEKAARAVSPPPASRPEPTGKGMSRTAFGILAVMLALALVGLYAQTRRANAQAEQIADLGGQVEGLQEQLSVAHTRLATYDMQFSMVQANVADLFQQIASLNELVNTDPFTAAAPSESEER
jgi:hypothetical protein